MRSIVKCSYNKPFVTKHYNSSACSTSRLIVVSIVTIDRYHTTTALVRSALPVRASHDKLDRFVSQHSPSSAVYAHVAPEHLQAGSG